MQKERTIGTTTLKTPYIGMGTWAIGGGTWWGENDDALSIRTIEEAIDRGIVWFDTAPVYGIGHSENVVGKHKAKSFQDPALHQMRAGMGS